MVKIFISYRRSDTRHITGRIYDRLVARYGKDNIFRDIDRKTLGVDFRYKLRTAVANCDVLLAVIGDKWESVTDENGNRRLDNPDDFVRIEIESALQRPDCLVVPILIDDAQMPNPNNLPADLRQLTFQDATYVRDSDFHADMNELIQYLDDYFNPRQEPPSMIETRVKIAPKAGVLLGGMMVMLVIVSLIVLAVLNGANQPTTPTPDPTHTTESVALVTDELSSTEMPITAPSDTPTASPTVTKTPSPTITPIPSDTPTEPDPDPFDIAAQLIQTENAGTETQTALDMTATATQWTLTPTSTPTQTPDSTQTIDAARAIIRTQTQSAIETQIALSFTPTFTPTYTPSPTPTIPPGYAGGVNITANEQWTPVEQEFDGVMMVLVPKGCFMMGSNDGNSDEQPVHEQCFDEPFWIDKYEVTQAQFAQFGGQKANVNYLTGDDLPVERITWFEARDYCEQRRGEEGDEFRLPTEREWEYAARGPNNLVYPWGNEFVADNVVYSGNSNSRTAPVGSRVGGVSWVGAMDMSGNVWEWVSSLYGSYPYDEEYDESINDNTNVRVLRGGSWDVSAGNVRSANRYRNTPSNELDGNGFRCLRSQ